MKFALILLSAFILSSCTQNSEINVTAPPTFETKLEEYKILEEDSTYPIYETALKSDSLVKIISKKNSKTEWGYLLKTLRTKVQKFTINASEDNIIQGKEGTQVLIPKNTFNSGEEITLKLKESYSKSSYLFDCLSTQTDSGDLLETAGMIELKAYSGSEEIQLNEDKEVTIKFPIKGEKKGDFNLFNQSLRKDSIVEWKLYPNGKDGFCLFEIDIKAGLDHVHLKGNRKELTFLTQKEKDLMARRMQNSISQRFPLLCASKKNKKITFSSRFYEKDKTFYEILSKIANNLDYLGFNIKNKLKADMTINFTFGNPNSDIDIKKYNTIIAERDKLNKFEQRKRLQELYSFYTLTSNKLGWINCDRFPNNSNKLINMNILAETKYEKFIFYIKEFNGALQPFQKKRTFQIKNIPENLLGVIIALKYENKKIYISRKKVKSSLKTIKGFDYEEVSLGQIENKIEEMAKF